MAELVPQRMPEQIQTRIIFNNWQYVTHNFLDLLEIPGPET